MKPNALLEKLGLFKATEESEQPVYEKPWRQNTLKKKMSRNVSSINDDGGKPINIKIKKSNSKIQNLFAKKLTAAAMDIEREKLERFEPAERFLMELIDSHKPSELVEYLQDMQKDEESTFLQSAKPSISKTGTVQLNTAD